MNPSKKRELDQNQPIKINSDNLIPKFQATKNCMSAIAAVDYAIKDTKPTCGLGMRFQIEAVKFFLVASKIIEIIKSCF